MLMLLADAVLVFLATLLLFELNWTVALINVVCCLCITLQSYGLACALLVEFNAFIAAGVLMAMGMAVEFPLALGGAQGSALFVCLRFCM